MRPERKFPGGAGNAAVVLLAAGLLLGAAFTAAAGDWNGYKEKFIAADGRVLDHFQSAISHSEGQGYALLLALRHDDRATFERVLRWATDNLQVRRDALFAWSWGRRPNGAWNVIDFNNASDGDILIALALAQAAERWNHPPFREAAARIAGDLRRHLAVTPGDYQLIAPAYFGFTTDAGMVFNTGYLILPAFARFARIDDEAFWERTLKDSRRLLERAAFSRFGLPPDWLTLENGRIAVHSARSPFFGYEAIRVPLYRMWSEAPERLEPFRNYLQFVERSGYLPSRVNLIDGTVSLEEAPAGFHAVMAACAERLGMKPLSQKLALEASARIKGETQDYFSYSLYLLAGGKLD
jgi:endoglucanase